MRFKVRKKVLCTWKGILMNTVNSSPLTSDNGSDVNTVNLIGAVNHSLGCFGESVKHLDDLFNEDGSQKKSKSDVGSVMHQYDAMVKNVLEAAEISKYRFDTQMKLLNVFVDEQNIREKVEVHLIWLGQEGLRLLALAA